MNWPTIIIIVLASLLLMKFLKKATRFILNTVLFLAVAVGLFYGVNYYGLGEKLPFLSSPSNQTIVVPCNDTIDCINSICIADSLNATSGKCGVLNESCVYVILNNKTSLLCPINNKTNSPVIPDTKIDV